MPGPEVTKRPLYLQVRDHLAQDIAKGIWRPGAALPNEQELARKLGVSTGTARKALDVLEEERIVVRRQGRGTFVVDQSCEDRAFRFYNMRDAEGRKVLGETELIEQTVVFAGRREQERLGIGPGDLVLRTRRLRRHAGRALMLEQTCLVMRRFPGLGEKRPGNYRISELAQKHGVHLGRASERVAVATATPEIAQHLGVDAGTAILQLDRVILSAGGEPMEWRRAYSRQDDDVFYVSEIG